MGKVQDTMNKLLAAMNDHDAEAVSALYADDAVAYDPFYPEPLRGRRAIEEDAAGFMKGFSDIRMEALSILEKDDRSGAAELRFSGTHDGPLTSPAGEIPATNKRMELRGGGFVKLNERGQIIEERRYYDPTQLLRQLGLAGAQPSEAGQPR